MPNAVNTGCMMKCSFGAAPSSLLATPGTVTAANMPMATIMDNKPMMNIPPFGVCMSLSNPQVAAATSAALGVLTPMPCIPATAAPWMPGHPTTMVGGKPALTDASTAMCNWGGVITIAMGAPTVSIG